MVVVMVLVITALAGLVDLVVVVVIKIYQEELEIQTLLQHIKEILVEQETQDPLVRVVAAVVPVVLDKLLLVPLIQKVEQVV
jgi:hypothetical protein|tara:strand:+ start:134 stop:379 length:246 start_codon:yes stop_codon:yes gene_type:complete